MPRWKLPLVLKADGLPEEEALFDANGWRAASLGPRILRAETAAIAALAVVASCLE
jgi:16S rRNA (uracil1498-N3)-methyltransferase